MGLLDAASGRYLVCCLLVLNVIIGRTSELKQSPFYSQQHQPHMSQSSLSRLLLNNSPYGIVNGNAANGGSQAANSRIHYESYKALLGETVRLECPQMNPTWFFRRVNSQQASADGHLTAASGSSDSQTGYSNQEDLIVTRHGVINADYKYKIMCHMSLKHKVIIVNNIEFDDEGLYTCLYTQPISSDLAGSDSINADTNPVQFRYVFNVTVYTLLSGLSMNLKPISMRTTTAIIPMLAPSLNNNINKKLPADQSYELVESSLTVRENEEFYINCIVESSKPASDIKFTLNDNSPTSHMNEIPSLNSNQYSSYLTLALTTTASPSQLPSSVISSNMNVIKNADRTYKTINSARIKVNQNDHGKVLTCKAENGFSNQKWENKKVLNVLFAPVCKDPPRHVYYVGINQTVTVECNIMNANPSRVTYEWDMDKLNGAEYVNKYSKLNGDNSDSVDFVHDDKYSLYDQQPHAPPFQHSGLRSSELIQSPVRVDASNNNNKFTSIHNDGLTSRFKWRPSTLKDFGEVICKATNEIGTTECVYEIKLGGVPNPPTDCNHLLKNTSAIISCQVGFHQGDPDIYCYLLRKSDNGVYKEHTRNRESCSFIVNDVNVNKLNEFWIYSSNKHGHNKDNGVYLTIGQSLKPAQQTNNRSFILIAVIVGLFLFILLICCFSLKFKKGLSDDNDSMFEGDAYQQSRNGGLGNGRLNGEKKIPPGSYPPKLMKGVKVPSPENGYDDSSSSDQKYLKIDLNTSRKYLNESNISVNNIDFGENKKVTKQLYEQEIYMESLSKLNEADVDASPFDVKKSSKKFILFKNSSSTNVNTPPHGVSFKTQPISRDKKINSVNNIVGGAGSTIRNVHVKKSISFNKSTNSHSNSNTAGDTTDDNAESAPLFMSNKNGLLTTVLDSSSSNSETTKTSSSFGVNDTTNLISKMVTFGSSNKSNNNYSSIPNDCMASNTMRRNSKINQSITTLTTQTTNANTTSTVIQSTTNTNTNTSSSSSSSTGTSTVSSTSPTASSTNNDLDLSANDMPLNNALTVSDQSFNIHQRDSSGSSCASGSSNGPIQTQRPNKLSTFDNYRSPKRFIGSTTTTNLGGSLKPVSFLSNISSSPAAGTKFSDIIESRFLNKLCEDIEVSLNVDCECADDYSMNDFSGDYSFDNELKSPVAELKSGPFLSNNINSSINGKNDTTKQLRQLTNRINSESQVRNVTTSASSRPSAAQIQPINNSPSKSQIGVLV